MTVEERHREALAGLDYVRDQALKGGSGRSTWTPFRALRALSRLPSCTETRRMTAHTCSRRRMGGCWLSCASVGRRARHVADDAPTCNNTVG